MRQLLVLILLFIPIKAEAVDYIMIGRGGASCGQFNQDIMESKQWEYIYHSWAEGCMSAIDIAMKNALENLLICRQLPLKVRNN